MNKENEVLVELEKIAGILSYYNGFLNTFALNKSVSDAQFREKSIEILKICEDIYYDKELRNRIYQKIALENFS